MIYRIYDVLLNLGSQAAIFIVSMIPFIELRGGIILGTALGMNWGEVLLIYNGLIN